MRKTAVVSGITGQDGAYLAKLLLAKNYRVVGLTRSYNNINKHNLQYLKIYEKISMEECDLLDFSSIVKVLKKYQPDEFYNLAAQSSVGLSFEQPIGTINYNSNSVLNVLETIRLLSPSTKFYQASSSEMFGKVQSLPITLDTPMHPLSPYAISKATAYWSVINYRESYNIFGVNGILFNHESYLRSNNFFVKKVIRTSIEIKNETKNELRVGNIDIKRDFGFAEDYVTAMWLAMQASSPDDYIICSGVSICLRDIIYYVFEKLQIPKSKLVEDHDLFRPTDIEDIYGDNSKSKNNLQWKYEKSFFDILDMLIEEEEANWQY